MNHDNRTVNPGRRSMLKTIGVMSAGALVAAPTVPGLSKTAFGGVLTGERPVRLGLILPGAAGERVKSGIDLALTRRGGVAGGRRVELLTEQPPGRISAIVTASRKLTEKDRADIVVGMMGSTATAWVRDIFEQRQTLLIEANLGERLTRRNERRSHIFHHSLGAWQSAMALGAWAAQNLGRSGAIVSSFYNSGYDTIAAFRCGFEGAGGTIVATHVTNTPQGGTTIVSALRDIGAMRPDFLFGAYSGAPAAAFIEACRHTGVAGRIPLLASGDTVDDGLAAARCAEIPGIRSAHTWSPTMANDANREFVGEFTRINGCQPDNLALLGYEIGLMIGEALDTAGGDTRNIERLAETFEGLSIASPRGRVTIDRESHTTAAPHYLRRTRGGSTPGNDVIARLRPDAAHAGVMHDQMAESRSGWIHMQPPV